MTPSDELKELREKVKLLPELVEALRMMVRTSGTPHYEDEVYADKLARSALQRYEEASR